MHSLITRRPVSCAVAAIALLVSAAVSAAPLPSPPQQLTVAFTNAFPKGSLDSLTMPNGGAAIANLSLRANQLDGDVAQSDVARIRDGMGEVAG